MPSLHGIAQVIGVANSYDLREIQEVAVLRCANKERKVSTVR